jgi:ABC-type dipeptide/oligopeptide/nickel transport system ATPase component
MGDPLLQIRISAEYRNKPAVLDDCRLEIGRGEILGLVGKSGCGKSTLSLAILGLLGWKGGRVRGSIRFNGRELIGLSEGELRKLRGREIALVLQSPMSALNPALKLGTQLIEAWRAHSAGTREECHAAIVQALENVSLPQEQAFLKRHPSEISVGQAQRVLIAMAILHRPLLVIADEPTSALDIITQSEILSLFSKVSGKLRTSVLFISHDLLSVATISQRVAVMENGTIVECRPTMEIFRDPAHPYTRQLVRALPVIPQYLRARATGATAG